MADEQKIAHLKMIQGVINRMGKNSFMIKGWTITLVSAILTLSIENHRFLFVSLFPILLFWFLDAFFLYQEKLFRELYNDVALKYDLYITYSMNTVKYQSRIGSIYKTAFSKTLLCFYGGMLLILGVIYLYYYHHLLEYVNLWIIKL